MESEEVYYERHGRSLITSIESYQFARKEFERYKFTKRAYTDNIETCLKDLEDAIANWPLQLQNLLDVNKWLFENLIDNAREPNYISPPRVDLSAHITTKDNLSIRWHASGGVEIKMDWVKEDNSDQNTNPDRLESKSTNMSDFSQHFVEWADHLPIGGRPDSELVFIREINVVNFLIEDGENQLAIHIANCVMSLFDTIKSFLDLNFKLTQIVDFEFQYDEHGNLINWFIFDVMKRKKKIDEEWLSNFAKTYGITCYAFVVEYLEDIKRTKFNSIGHIKDRKTANNVLEKLQNLDSSLSIFISHQTQRSKKKLELRRKINELRSKSKHAAKSRSDWEELSKKELTELVWLKPVTKIAQDFGVSDVAIAKKCKKLGVSKPPVGFWAKVHSGKILHPNGKNPFDK